MPGEEVGANAGDDGAQKDPLVKRLQSWAALVIAIGGVITTFVKPQDHSATKAAYEELVKDIEQLNAQNKTDHDNIVALRAYVALKEGQPLFQQQQMAEEPEPAAPAKPHSPAAKPPRKPAPAASSAPPAPAAAADEPPPLHDEAPPVHPPAFDAVVAKVK